MQLRLQQTVEGLSVAAISYYVVGLAGYVFKGAKDVGCCRSIRAWRRRPPCRSPSWRLPSWSGASGNHAAAKDPEIDSALFLPSRTELLEIGEQVVDLVLVLDAGEDHLGAGDLRLRVLDVLLERRLVPGDARVLVRLGVVVALDRAGVPADQAVQNGADGVLGGFADLVAGPALAGRLLAGGGILGRGVLRSKGSVRRASRECERRTSLHRVISSGIDRRHFEPTAFSTAGLRAGTSMNVADRRRYRFSRTPVRNSRPSSQGGVGP